MAASGEAARGETGVTILCRKGLHDITDVKVDSRGKRECKACRRLRISQRPPRMVACPDCGLERLLHNDGGFNALFSDQPCRSCSTRRQYSGLNYDMHVVTSKAELMWWWCCQGFTPNEIVELADSLTGWFSVPSRDLKEAA